MRLLIEGIGSIGQRHYRNARALGHEAAILRTSTTMRPFVQAFFDEQAKEGNTPLVFTSLESAIAEFKPEALVICTPNHLHLASALAGAKRGLHLLIEKPAHNHAEGIDELAAIVAEKNLTTLVGYNLRFHPLLKHVQQMVEDGELGIVLSAAVEVGENIEDWHPWENYTDTYAPYVASGGGSLLCFSHDIDYLYWILGTPKDIFATGGKVTPLTGDAEDLVQSLWGYEDKKTATLHIDYWQRPKVRTLKIVGSKKSVLWDAYANLSIWDHETGEKLEESEPSGFERNSMFLDELRHFISCAQEGKQTDIPLSQGAEVVAIIERMKAALV